MKKVIIYFFLLKLWILPLWSNPALLPFPQKIEWSNTHFNFNQKINLIFTENTTEIRDSIHLFFKNKKTRFSENAKNQIHIGLISHIRGAMVNQNEAYELIVSKNKITLYATTKTGLFYGFQTLKQLTLKNKVQGCKIVDFPAFKIRGFMHDVGRSFNSI